MTSDSEVPEPSDGIQVAVTTSEWIRRMPPTPWLRDNAAYRDAMVPSVLQPHLPPEWDPADRPSQPHRLRDCEQESTAGRTKKPASGRAEHCCCGNRRALTPEGEPDSDWVGHNSALIASTAPDGDTTADDHTGFWRRVLRHLHPAKERRDGDHIPRG